MLFSYQENFNFMFCWFTCAIVVQQLKLPHTTVVQGKTARFPLFSSFHDFCMSKLYPPHFDSVQSRIHFLRAIVPPILDCLEISNERDFIRISPFVWIQCAMVPFTVFWWERNLWQRASIERVKIEWSNRKFPHFLSFRYGQRVWKKNSKSVLINGTVLNVLSTFTLFRNNLSFIHVFVW